MNNTIYDFKVTTINNEILDLETLRGKVILIVNTASRCGFSNQYQDLEKLYKQFAHLGFEVLAFPCNQFANQEPANAEQISSYCELNFGITFPLMAKIDVNGNNADPLYKFLKQRAKGILGSTSIKWNFTKFLISRDGKTIVRFPSIANPRRLVHGIQSLLDA